MAEEEVEKILQRVDADGSGEIDYSGKLRNLTSQNGWQQQLIKKTYYPLIN